MSNLYIDNVDFAFSNIAKNSHMRVEGSFYFLFGYCFLGNLYKRNERLTEEEFDLIKESNISCSGIFGAVKVVDGKITIVLDPLCQFNVFYYFDRSCNSFVIANSILLIKKFLPNCEFSNSYFFDQVAYQSPMRGKTILRDVYYIQYDDLRFSNPWNQDFEYLDNISNINLVRPDYNAYDRLSYKELKQKYVENLKERAQSVSSNFEEVHVQLTGGADSRLAFAALTSVKDIYSYVYGDGKSQNRLIFERILKAKKQSPVEKIEFVGQPLNTAERIIKGVIDSNFMKLNTLNTYMNSNVRFEQSKCKVTGYYGANVCGGVVLPPSDTSKNPRLEKFNPEIFDYHDYIDYFKERHGHRRRTSFNDFFYINNRGKGHYSAHSLADNQHVASVDILYDYINLILVEKCPYSDFEIDKNAISIDLIYEFDKQLALFPYDSRKIPKFRQFHDIPLINCFDGYDFPPEQLPEFIIERPSLEVGSSIIKFTESSGVKGDNFIEAEKFREQIEKFPMFRESASGDGAQSDIIRYYVLARLFLEEH